MAEVTKIQWCDHTFNPWIGCTKVNEGCKFCYAETLMDTRYGRVKWGPQGTRSRTKTWKDPLRWNRTAGQQNLRAKVFCASLADVFEDRAELAPWRSELWQLIDRCQNLDWLLLTKRPENIRRMWEGPNRGNVWLGTSIANQANAEEWVPRLLGCTGLAPILFLSVEPQIGPVDLSRFFFPQPTIHWVIVGGESRQGHGEPRLFHVEWARRIVQQCREATVPCFVKQLGSNCHLQGRRLPLQDLHGGNWTEWPADLRVRQCPERFFPQLEYAREI